MPMAVLAAQDTLSRRCLRQAVAAAVAGMGRLWLEEAKAAVAKDAEEEDLYYPPSSPIKTREANGPLYYPPTEPLDGCIRGKCILVTIEERVYALPPDYDKQAATNPSLVEFFGKPASCCLPEPAVMRAFAFKDATQACQHAMELPCTKVR